MDEEAKVVALYCFLAGVIIGMIFIQVVGW